MPVYSFADEYSLFEYIETPFISPGSSENVAMRIHSDTKLVAISKDDSKHQVYSYEQLQKCQQVGTNHGSLLLCPDANIYFQDEHKSCVIGLFKRDSSIIKDYCRWKMVPREPYALQKSSNQFLVFLPDETEAKFVCDDGTRSLEKRMEIIGHNIVTVQGMCRAYIGR